MISGSIVTKTALLGAAWAVSKAKLQEFQGALMSLEKG